MTTYALSFKRSTTDRGERVYVHQFVSVGSEQIQPGTVFSLQMPDAPAGKILALNVAGQEDLQPWMSLGGNEFRELTRAERLLADAIAVLANHGPAVPSTGGE